MKRSGPIRSKPSPTNPTARLRLVCEARSLGQCERCGCGAIGRPGIVLHHRRLRSQGGGNDPSNLAAICSPCHELVHSERELIGEPFGWIVPGWCDPATAPIDHWQRGATYLTPDGGYEVSP